MKDGISIRLWLSRFAMGMYNSTDRDTQCEAGWYDWFCKDSSLAKKTQTLGKKLQQIVSIGTDKFDQDRTYVFFMNNCPGNGSLYDDFRICDLKTGDVLYTITPSNGHASKKGQAGVWGRENGFDGPLIEGTWKDVLAFFARPVLEKKKEEKAYTVKRLYKIAEEHNMLSLDTKNFLEWIDINKSVL